MIQYFDNGDLACFDGLSFRLDKKTGYYLNAKTHKRLHVYMWEFYNGNVPKGYHVHHKDFNKSNNDISNLALLTQKEHFEIHGSNITESRKVQMAKNLAENARPEASKWHSSDAGKIWHKEHYEKMKSRLYIKRKFVCQNCGKEFESSQVNSKFCCNNCRSAARRKSGIDNVTKICEKCGAEYEASKYQKTKYCKDCHNRS